MLSCLFIAGFHLALQAVVAVHQHHHLMPFVTSPRQMEFPLEINRNPAMHYEQRFHPKIEATTTAATTTEKVDFLIEGHRKSDDDDDDEGRGKGKGKGKGRAKGFLGLFEVIEINNTKCSVEMADGIRTMDGICYYDLECKNLGGIPTKTCANGAGVCCIFVNSCGDTTDQTIIYFESPSYPQPIEEMMICVLIINLRPKIEQLHLDFLMFELNRPTNGDCIDDQFIVSGHNMNYGVPILCGINTGQHMFLHVGNSFEKRIYLSFFAKVAKGGRTFNIKIIQLEENLAPTNCLQYFIERENVIKSFNYDIDGAIVQDKEATYLNNLNYAICLERAAETCTVTYYVEEHDANVEGGPSFQIINKDEAENDMVPDGEAGAGIFNCPDDYIAINSVRLCGERFNDGIENDDFRMNAAIRDMTAGPVVLPVRTDSEYVGRGFRLRYKQEPCV